MLGPTTRRDWRSLFGTNSSCALHSPARLSAATRDILSLLPSTPSDVFALFVQLVSLWCGVKYIMCICSILSAAFKINFYVGSDPLMWLSTSTFVHN